MSNDEQVTARWYSDYYSKRGRLRNDLLRNPEVLFQHLAFQASIIQALGAARLDALTARLLDVGCGTGGSLATFLALGFAQENFFGADILQDRIEEARHRYPVSNFVHCDASSLPFEAEFFDLTIESTMFVQLTDESLASNIASEMIRTTKKGGYLLLIDWRYSKPWDAHYRGLSSARVRRLFGGSTELVVRPLGALIPPIGRLLSKHGSPMYFLAKGVMPFLAGQRATLLRRTS